MKASVVLKDDETGFHSFSNAILKGKTPF
jgi:hypothetical protein